MSSSPPDTVERGPRTRPTGAVDGRRGMTLRAKGLLALAALVTYVAILAAVFVKHQEGLIHAFDELTRMRKLQSDLHAIGLSVARAAAGTHAASSRLDGGARGGRWLLDVDQVIDTARALQRDREVNVTLDALISATATFRAERSRESLAVLERVLDESAAAFADAYTRVSAWEEARSNAVRRQAQTMVVTMLIIGLLGIALIAAVIVQFFTRMATDLRLLRRRAIDVVFGRSQTLPVERPDEVGELTITINQLGRSLAQRERELELERGRRFHNEKMAAVGALAAGVITEIGNPLAAIDGYARTLKDGKLDEAAGRDVDAILEQTARLVTVTRDIAALSERHRSERELVDINTIVKDAVRLVHYDPRVRADRIDVALDTKVPAFSGMADRLLQLVLSMIGNATEDEPSNSATAGRIRMATFATRDGVALEMSTVVATGTKSQFTLFADPSTHEAGRGLSLCKSIVDEHGGSLRVETIPQGTRVLVTFPYGEEMLAVES